MQTCKKEKKMKNIPPEKKSTPFHFKEFNKFHGHQSQFQPKIFNKYTRFSLYLLWFSLLSLSLSVVVSPLCSWFFFLLPSRSLDVSPWFHSKSILRRPVFLQVSSSSRPVFLRCKKLSLSLYSEGPCFFKICTSGPVFLLGFIFTLLIQRRNCGGPCFFTLLALRFEGPVIPSKLLRFQGGPVFPSKQARDSAQLSPVKKFKIIQYSLPWTFTLCTYFPSLGLSNSKKGGTIVFILLPPPNKIRLGIQLCYLCPFKWFSPCQLFITRVCGRPRSFPIMVVWCIWLMGFLFDMMEGKKCRYLKQKKK